MKQTEDTTPEQYRAELIDEKHRLQAEINFIKSAMAKAFHEKDHQALAELAKEKAELVSELSEIDSDLRQLKQELQQPNNNLSDLSLIVQLVAAEITHSGTFDAHAAISRLDRIKEALTETK